MALSETGKRLAEASFRQKADEINRSWAAGVNAAKRKHASNLNAASLPAELIGLGIRRMEDLAGAWVTSFLQAAQAEKALLSAGDIGSILTQLESMTQAGVDSELDSAGLASVIQRGQPSHAVGADIARARAATLARWSDRLNHQRLRNTVIADLVDVKRQNARRQASENVPRIASEYAAKGLALSGPLVNAQYRNWLTAVDEVVQEFLRAEETEPLNLERISVESWLAEAKCDSSSLLEAEFDWLRSQVSTLLSGSLSALEGLRGHFAGLVETDRNRFSEEIEKRLRIVANRRRSSQGAVEAPDSGLSDSEWPTKATSPGRGEQADGLPMLFKKDLVDADLKAAVAFASGMRLPVAILMIDLDHFKQLNDEFGHQKGDEVLSKVSNVLCSVLGSRGRVYRYGGEEMCVLAPNFTREEAFALAERIRREVSETRIKGVDRPITVSAGVATHPYDGDEPATLIKSADDAMYKAKEAGRNRVVAFDQQR